MLHAAGRCCSVPPVHDGLQDGGEGRDPDAGADEHSVLRVEDQVGRRAEGTVDENLQRVVNEPSRSSQCPLSVLTCSELLT